MNKHPSDMTPAGGNASRLPLAISDIASAIEDIRLGRMVILVDDEDRENEGDLVIAAEKVTPEAIAFMAQHGRGLICLSLDAAPLDKLGLAPMASSNQAPLSTAFTESIDAVDCVGSGVSASDRAHTIRRAVAPGAGPDDFRVPGHVFPLRARRGGVLVRSGQTEGSVDLARLAGLHPSGVICEVMGADGTMQRLDALLDFGARYGIRVVTVADLIEHRIHHEPLVREVARSVMPTPWARFEMRLFRAEVDGSLHVALVLGSPSAERPALVRVHRANLIGDAFGLRTARGQQQLELALQTIAAAGEGALIYLGVRDSAADLAEALRGYVARDGGVAFPTADAAERKMDFKEFGLGAQILRALGLGEIRVLTNSPRRLRGVSGFGLRVVEWLPLGEPSASVPGHPGALT
jgi:3,4-dihydroxy 2-butanone 4-phosphate synthase / GTP cyclohydrolase II